MNTIDLYSQKQACCGCEACVQVCPKKIINIKADSAGFLYPIIEDNTSCIQCGRCVKVCPVKSSIRGPHSILNSYGGFSRVEDEIKRSASGGLATSINRAAINKGWVVYGVSYTCDFRSVEYKRCTTLPEIETLRTSKYVQAKKNEVYNDVKNDLKQGNAVLFVGLPCEVSALYNVVGEQDNLFTVSLICHGPTSPKVHAEFCHDQINKHHGASITFFSVRHKHNAWKPYYVYASFKDGSEFLEQFHKSDYGIAFRQLKRPSCSECRYKVYDKQFGMPADLTIGDFHYAHPKMEHYNHWGSSQVCSHTEKGDRLLQMVSTNFNIYPISERVAVRYNLAFYRAIQPRGNQQEFARVFSRKSLHDSCTLFSVKAIDAYIKNVALLKKSLLRIVKPILVQIRKKQ